MGRDGLHLLAVAEVGGGPGGDSLFLFLSAPLFAPAPAVPFSVPLAIVPHTLVLEAGSCKWGCLSCLPVLLVSVLSVSVSA